MKLLWISERNLAHFVDSNIRFKSRQGDPEIFLWGDPKIFFVSCAPGFGFVLVAYSTGT